MQWFVNRDSCIIRIQTYGESSDAIFNFATLSLFNLLRNKRFLIILTILRKKNQQRQINRGYAKSESEFYENHRLNIFISVWWISVIYESWFTNRHIKKGDYFILVSSLHFGFHPFGYVEFTMQEAWLFEPAITDLYIKNQHQKTILHAQWNKMDFSWKSNRYKIVIMNI